MIKLNFIYRTLLVFYSEQEFITSQTFDQIKEQYKRSNHPITALFAMAVASGSGRVMKDFIALFKADLISSYYELILSLGHDAGLLDKASRMEFLFPPNLTCQSLVHDNAQAAELSKMLWEEDFSFSFLTSLNADLLRAISPAQQGVAQGYKWVLKAPAEEIAEQRRTLCSGETYHALIDAFAKKFGNIEFAKEIAAVGLLQRGFEREVADKLFVLEQFQIVQYRNELLSMELQHFESMTAGEQIAALVRRESVREIVCEELRKIYIKRFGNLQRFVAVVKGYISDTCDEHFYIEQILSGFAADAQIIAELQPHILAYISKKMYLQEYKSVRGILRLLYEAGEDDYRWQEFEVQFKVAKIFARFGIKETWEFFSSYSSELVLEKMREMVKNYFTGMDKRKRGIKLSQEKINIDNSVSFWKILLMVNASLKNLLKEDDILDTFIEEIVCKSSQVKFFQQFYLSQEIGAALKNRINEIILSFIEKQIKLSNANLHGILIEYLDKIVNTIDLANESSLLQTQKLKLQFFLILAKQLYIYELKLPFKDLFERTLNKYDVLQQLLHKDDYANYKYIDLYKAFRSFEDPCAKQNFDQYEDQFCQFLSNLGIKLIIEGGSIDKINATIHALESNKSPYLAELLYSLAGHQNNLKKKIDPKQTTEYYENALWYCNNAPLLGQILDKLYEQKSLAPASLSQSMITLAGTQPKQPQTDFDQNASSVQLSSAPADSAQSQPAKKSKLSKITGIVSRTMKLFKNRQSAAKMINLDFSFSDGGILNERLQKQLAGNYSYHANQLQKRFAEFFLQNSAMGRCREEMPLFFYLLTHNSARAFHYLYLRRAGLDLASLQSVVRGIVEGNLFNKEAVVELYLKYLYSVSGLLPPTRTTISYFRNSTQLNLGASYKELVSS